MRNKVNYAEVDSDVDMSEGEKELERERVKGGTNEAGGGMNKGKAKAGDTYGTTNNKKRFKSKAAQQADQSRSTTARHDSKLLLELPFDLFVEVCSHVEGKDLLSLAKVNQSMRQTLLSRAARPIWSSCRRLQGFELPSGLTELDFALLEYSSLCQVCEKHDEEREWTMFLRVRFCKKCYKINTIASKGLKKAWPDLHPFATRCVRYADESKPWTAYLRPIRYLISDLEAVNQELQELEEEDDIAVSLLANHRSKSSSTRSRRTLTPAKQIEVDRVGKYVKEREKWVQSEQQTSRGIVSNRERIAALVQRAAARERQALREARDKIIETLKTEHGWTSDEGDYIRCIRDFDNLAPTASVNEDPTAWETWRATIRQKIDERAAAHAESTARNARKSLLQPYYDSSKTLQDGWNAFPSFSTFCRFKAVLPLWEPEDAVLNDKLWDELRSDLIQDLEHYAEENRIEAIRQILAANRGLSSASTLSKDPADYPATTYDNEFFSRATSLFASRGLYGRRSGLVVAPFPRTTHEPRYFGPQTLSERTSVRQVLIVRTLIEAAGLDIHCTALDLDEVEEAFVWTNDARKTYRDVKRNWRNMLDQALRYGPSSAKLARGETFEFECRPGSDQEDQEGETEHEEEDD